MENGLVAFHGRAQRKIKEVSYKKSFFLSLDEEAMPDFYLDYVDRDTPKDVGRKFNFIIDAFCPMATVFKGLKSIYTNPYEDTVYDGELNDRFFKNSRRLLKNNGILYMPHLFHGYDSWDEHDDGLFAAKMFRFGFKIEGLSNFTFDKSVIEFVGFQKTALPTRKQVIDFISTIENIRYMKATMLHEEEPDEDTYSLLIYPEKAKIDDFVLDENLTSLIITTNDDKTIRLI